MQSVYRILIVVSCFSLMSLPGKASASTSVAMAASVTSTTPGFQKYIYSFSAPGASPVMTGLSGTVSIANPTPHFSEMLISMFYATAACPKSGQSFAAYSDLFNANPGLQLIWQDIVKNPSGGTSTLNVNFTLPAGIPISSCVGYILDGGGSNESVIMAANLSLSFNNGTLSTAPFAVGAGGEYCFGQDWGCMAATTNNAQSFATASPISKSGTLLTLLGDMSDSSFDGTGSYGPLPTGLGARRMIFIFFMEAAVPMLLPHKALLVPEIFIASFLPTRPTC